MYSKISKYSWLFYLRCFKTITVEDAAAGEVVEAAEAEETGIPALEKCIRQLVPNADRKPRFLSSRLRENRFSAEIATKKGEQADTKLFFKSLALVRGF